MEKNIGAIDRSIRIMAGLVFLGLAADGSMWGLIGIVPLLTGIIGWCPAYRLLRVSTAASCGTQS